MTPEAAAVKYPKMFSIAEDGVLEIYADNHILSSYRKCPGYFQEFILNNYQSGGRQWSLEFGQYFHKMMEFFYQAQRDEWKGKFIVAVPVEKGYKDVVYNQNFESFLEICKWYWDQYNLQSFEEHPAFKKLGGYLGAFNLFLQYYNTHFQQERLRVVGTELSFGRAREVPILDFSNVCETFGEENFRAYYCGRIDLVVDDGTIIGPMDHKTTSYFDGSERSKFKPHDGMQGYVYAFQKMLPEPLRAAGRTCSNIYINHISIGYKKDQTERFKHSIISYTPAEMEEWRLRQVRTFTDIYRYIILEEPVYWDTERCGMWYGFTDCPYKVLHEAAPLSRDVIAKSHFVQLEPWSHDRA